MPDRESQLLPDPSPVSAAVQEVSLRERIVQAILDAAPPWNRARRGTTPPQRQLASVDALDTKATAAFAGAVAVAAVSAASPYSPRGGT